MVRDRHRHRVRVRVRTICIRVRVWARLRGGVRIGRGLGHGAMKWVMVRAMTRVRVRAMH